MKTKFALIFVIIALALSACGVSKDDLANSQATQQAFVLTAIANRPTESVPPTPQSTPVAQQPTPMPVTNNAANLQPQQLWTVPHEPALGPSDTVNGQYTINTGEIAAFWWKVTVNGQTYKNPNKGTDGSDCSGYYGIWLSPGTYSLVGPGRIRVWNSPQSSDVAAYQQWWENLVQQEAGNICTYIWLTK